MIRKNYFINYRLQWKYLWLTVFVTGVSALIVYITLDRVVFGALEEYGFGLARVVELKKSFTFSFALISVFLIVAFGLASVVVFQKIVGPLFVMEKAAKAIAAGDLTQEVHLRKTDDLKDFFIEFNAMQQGLRSLVQKDREVLRGITVRIEQLNHEVQPEKIQGELKQILAELADVTARYKL